MADERCIHDLLVGTCATCADQQAARAQAPTGRPAFRRGAQAMADAYPPVREVPLHPSDPAWSERLVARFETTCPECREPIAVGDTIAPGRDGFYVHEECA